MNKIKLAILFLQCGFMACVQAQMPGNDFAAKAPPVIRERIFVHTDKSFYVTGEIIWFKLYVRDQSLRPARISRIAYVEIIGGNGQAVLQAKIELDAGTGSGSMHLPLSIHSGNYYIRAYTMWMKNQGPGSFFEKQLTIVNTRQSGVAVAGNKDPYDIQFFPEGGRLVQGLENTIAFKVTGRNGKGVTGSGFILSPQGDTLQQFRTFRYGMGRFTFQPLTTQPYTVWMQLPDTLLAMKLPAAEAEGHTLHMRQDADSVTVMVETNAPGGGPLILVAHSGGQTLFPVAGRSAGRQTLFRMPAQLPSGLTRFTILNERLQPVCERLYFRKPETQLNVSIQTGKEIFGIRERVSLEIQTTVSGKDTLPAHLSLSVFLLDELQAPEEENIMHYFWLGSELKGRIEDPGFYFSGDAAVVEATENLLLTQGWRRIDTIGQNAPPGFLPEWEGPVVNARLVSKNGTAPLHHKMAYFSFAGERFQLASAVSDSSGNLNFITRPFYGRGDMVLQPADSNYYITLAEPFSDQFSETRVPALQLSASLAGSLNRRSISSQVQNQFAGSSIAKFETTAADTTPFYGLPDKRYLLDEYTRFTTMEEVLREFVAEVRLRKTGSGIQLQVRNQPDLQFFEQPPLVLLDGVPVLNTNSLVDYNPLHIKKIEVVARRYVYGAQSYPGIISFSTYQGDLSGFPLPAAAMVLSREGVQWQRIFYAPVYDAPEQKESRMPDFRNQLQWIPNLETNSSGTAKVSFFTSDLTGRFAIVLQGITAAGLPGAALHFMEVKKP